MRAGFGWIKTAVLIAPILFCGCAERHITFPRYAGGGVLTDSLACFYDFDRNGFWYVVFLRGPWLVATDHRHAYGTHVLLRPNGDMLFFVRCSGRNEVIDLSGQFFELKNGRVFLTDLAAAKPRSTQLNFTLPRFVSDDEKERTRVLMEAAQQRQVAAFLSSEAQNRLYLDYKSALQESVKKQRATQTQSK